MPCADKKQDKKTSGRDFCFDIKKVRKKMKNK